MKYSFNDFNSINEGWDVNSLLNCKYFTKYSTLVFSVKKDDFNNLNSFVEQLNIMFNISIDRGTLRYIKEESEKGIDYYLRITKNKYSPEPTFDWGYSELETFINNIRDGSWVHYDNYKIYTFEEVYENLDKILRLTLVPDYKPKRFDRTLESIKNKVIYPYKEIYIKVESIDEYDNLCEKLKTIDDRLFKIDIDEYPLPNYIFIDVQYFHIYNKLDYTFLTHDDIEGALQSCVYNDPSVNPYYFTLKEWNKIRNILLTGSEVGNAPTYEPKKFNRTLESKENETEPYNTLIFMMHNESDITKTISELYKKGYFFYDMHRVEEVPNYPQVLWVNLKTKELNISIMEVFDLKIIMDMVKEDNEKYNALINPTIFKPTDIKQLESIKKTGNVIPTYEPKKFNRILESVENNKYSYFNEYSTLIIVFDIDISMNYFKNVLNMLNDVFNLNMTYDFQYMKCQCVINDETKFYIEITWNEDISAYTRGWCNLSYLKTDKEHNQYTYPEIVDVTKIDTKQKLEKYLYTTGNVPSYKPKKFNRLLESKDNNGLRRKLTNDKYEVILFDAIGMDEQINIFNYLNKLDFLDDLNTLKFSNIFDYIYVIITKHDTNYKPFSLYSFGRNNIYDFFRDYHPEFDINKVSPTMTIDELKNYINKFIVPSYKSKKISRDI